MTNITRKGGHIVPRSSRNFKKWLINSDQVKLLYFIYGTLNIKAARFIHALF